MTNRQGTIVFIRAVAIVNARLKPIRRFRSIATAQKQTANLNASVNIIWFNIKIFTVMLKCTTTVQTLTFIIKNTSKCIIIIMFSKSQLYIGIFRITACNISDLH